ncbi:MAG TPA: MarR family transcriptional regulator [Ruminiclostridium sp.]
MQNAEKRLLAQDLAKMIQQFKRHVINKASFQELRQSEFILLATINNFNAADPRGVKVSELSTYMEITPAAVTHMVNSIEEAGYLERLPAATDRRVVLVKLTESGKLLCGQKEKKFLSYFEGLVEFMGDQDSKELKRLLTLMYTYSKERKK